MEPTFNRNDEHGLLVGSIPYYCGIITEEQFGCVKNKTAKIFNIDGRYFFPLKNSQGDFTGEFAFYVIFE